ncbi:HMCN1 [Branchiostoma lanceolatum]|uniref:HMCN1 protein n=1 Tax=Branchiostoma lanceolatum TaxID=7740 RepID=A0A8J9VIW4_BRALA|nr:HMCN1 [Branchiostoma lanceolatum]
MARLDPQTWIALSAFLLIKGSSAETSVGITLPKSISTRLGEPATLSATFTTNRQIISIGWYKVDKKEEIQKRELVYSYYPPLGRREAHGQYAGRTQLVGKASLKINPTRLEDEGVYVLSVMAEGLGNEEGFVQLSIMVPPTVQVGPSDPYVTSLGRTASLSCAVGGAKPNITSLHWEKDGEILQTARLGNKYTGGTIQTPSLLIRHMRRADAGMYTCVADHVVRGSRASLTLNVQYPASIISISESITATVSDSVTLQCVADGNPPPNITWSKNGMRLRSLKTPLSMDVMASTLLLKKIHVNDTGMYLCVAGNDIGETDTKSISLTVKQYRTDQDIDSSKIAIIVGGTAGGLWLVVCIGLGSYLFRRRRKQKEKKQFAFYYNMASHRKPGVGNESRNEEDKEPPPYSAMPAKLQDKAPTRFGGINTIRKSIGKKDRRYACALYSYRPREENELTMEVDDVIEVLEGEDGGWCLGYLRGRIGLFPSNYVKFLSSSEVLAMKTGRHVDVAEASGTKRSI